MIGRGARPAGSTRTGRPAGAAGSLPVAARLEDTWGSPAGRHGPTRTSALYRRVRVILSAAVVLATAARGPLAQAEQPAGPTPSGAQDEAFHAPFEALLDLYVRDGFVYYPALRADGARLDRYLASLDVPPAVYERWSRPRQMAFWINAYNAFVLRTVIDHYPIRGRAEAYPSNSVRQIPGAFDRLRHRAAGRSVTLDEIEYMILPTFEDPRVYFALGRGAVGSPRLRSEAFTAGRLEQQLADATREIATTPQHIRIDPAADQLLVTPVIGWHEAEFGRAFGSARDGPFASRSPVERAIIALIEPHLLPREREFLRRNTFGVRYLPFDWRLNDLSDR